MSHPLPPATQPPPIKTPINNNTNNINDDVNSNTETNLSPQVTSNTINTISEDNSSTPTNAPSSPMPDTSIPTEQPVQPQQQQQQSPPPTQQQQNAIIPERSDHLLQDPKIQEIMLSDAGSTALLTRLKQSYTSCREFATFAKKKAQLESEHQAAVKKLARGTRETIKKPEGRQGTFVTQFDEMVKSNERVSDVGSTFVAALHKMHDELSELAKNCEKNRKIVKERCLREEKNLSDAEQMAERSKGKYDSLAEDFEKMRTGDPTKNRFGFKQSKTPQHEEELQKKVIAAEADYKQRVEHAAKLRSELINKQRPVTVKELKNLILECDSGISLQLAKYANLNETLALNTGFIIAPLRPQNSATAPLTMKQVAAKVDNELDFYKYVMAIPKSKKLNRPVVQYRQHPAMAAAYPTVTKPMAPQQPSPPLPKPMSSVQGPATAAVQQQQLQQQNLNKETNALSPSVSSPQPPPHVQSQSQPQPQAPQQRDRRNSSGGAPNLSPASTTNTNTATSTAPSVALAYPPGMSTSLMPTFGTDLEELLDYEEATVPRVVYQCIQAVDAFGLEVEGIYRHTGNSQQSAEIKRLFDTDSQSVDLLQPSANLNDIHSVASALKQFFRELPDSLMTREFHQEFIDAARIEHDGQRRDAIHATINKLPDANYSTLRYLTFHLYRVQEREAINRMSIDNLGIVWGPTLMASESVEDMAIQGRIISIIIFNAYTIFDAD